MKSILFILILLLTACSSSEAIVIGSGTCPLPCLYGVTPGQTPYEDAPAIVNASLSAKNVISQTPDEWIYQEETDRFVLSVKRSLPGDNTVTFIELAAIDNGQIISLGEMLNSGYTPEMVFRARTIGPDTLNLLIVFGKDQNIIATITATRNVIPDTPITSLVLVHPSDANWVLQDIRTIHHFDTEIEWLGYRPIADYFE